MKSWAAEDDLVAEAFDGYAFYKRVDYADLFPDASGTVGARALDDLAAWFEVPAVFTNRPNFAKLSSLPLDQTIENFDTLEIALRGTRFEEFLEDEPAYRAPCEADR